MDREEIQGEYVALEKFARENSLKILSDSGCNEVYFSTFNVNRPGLLLAGFDDYFGEARVQVIGYAEHYYLDKHTRDERVKMLELLFSKKVPCLIYSRDITPNEEVITIAQKYSTPVLKSEKITSQLVNDLVTYFNGVLAPVKSMHGVLVEVSGLGVLLTGHTGVGKSETALELIHRGHRLVADDAVILKRIQNEIVGTPPPAIEHFMEIRGIGIIDVRSMFGVGSVLNERKIDLVIEFFDWNQDSDPDRLGLKSYTENIFGVEIPKLKVPVMAGRNLAIVVEVAARNQRLKKLGYNALDALLNNANIPKHK